MLLLLLSTYIRRLQCRLLVGRRPGNLQLGRAGEHLGETDTDALDDGEQDGTADGTVSRGLVASSDRESTASEETSDDGVVGILLLAHALDGAVESREQTAPDAKVTAQDGRSHLHSGDGADTSFTIGRVSEALDTVPNGAANGLPDIMLARNSGR